MMRKMMLLGIAVLLVMFCASCGVENVPEATQIPETVPAVIATQPHVCAEACGVCGLCMNAGCAEAVCAEKCTGTHWEEPFAFSAGDYITTETVRVDTGTLVFDIDENVYVPGNLAEMGEIIATEIEKVTGLDFDGAGYARDFFPDGKVHINISRDCLYTERDWYRGLKTSEVGNAYGGSSTHVFASPGDLLLGHSNAMVHELTHVLMFRQSAWSHSQLLNEGFAEYTTYLVMSDLEKTDPQAAFYLDHSEQSLIDMRIWDYDKLFEHPIEYWFENTFEYSSNENYTVGFRFMAYLHDVYGDYSKWIPAYEAQYPHRNSGEITDKSTAERQIEVLKVTYGEDVLDNFYPWLKNRLDRFVSTGSWRNLKNQQKPAALNWYPNYNAIESVVWIRNLEYNDLYLNIETVRKYLGEYKQQDVSDLVLITSEPVRVELYQADGTYTSAMTNSQKAEKAIESLQWDANQQGYVYVFIEDVLSLENISYIKLVGEGKLELIEIAGDFRVMFK